MAFVHKCRKCGSDHLFMIDESYYRAFAVRCSACGRLAVELPRGLETETDRLSRVPDQWEEQNSRWDDRPLESGS